MKVETHLLKPKTGIYHGPTSEHAFNRSIPDCEAVWNVAGFSFSYDDLMATQIQLAINQGRNSVNHTDIGSGNSGLFRDFVTNQNAMLRTRQLLLTNPNFRVRLIGLTDAQNADSFLTSTPVCREQYFSLNNQVEATTVQYTLTAAQRLQSFFTHMNLNRQADLVTSTSCLQYLGPSSFRHTIIDIIHNLRGSGAVFVGAELSRVNHLTNSVKGSKQFQIPDYLQTGVPAILRDKDNLPTDTLNLFDKISALRSAFQLFYRIGILGKDVFIQKITQIDDLDKSDASLETTISDLLNFIKIAEKVSIEKREHHLWEAKKTALEELQQQYGDQIELKVTSECSDGVYIEKL